MKNFVIVLLSLILINAYSKDIEINDAAKAGKNHYYQHINQIMEKDFSDIKLYPVYTGKSENNENLFYVFNVNSNDGFIIVSAEDQTTPVLAYSFNSSFDATNLPPAVEMILGYYQKQIEFVRTNPQENEKSFNEWNELLAYSPSKGIKDIMTVSPLLHTTWNQTGYYNEFCPEDAAASDGRVPVGCVAVAMGQAMKYYNYPTTGQGSNSYSYWWGWDYGTLSANFGTTTYHWENMPNSLSGINDPVAELLYHCGVAVEMYYAADGSGADMGTAADKMVDNFKYSSSISLKNKSSYSESGWNTLMVSQLDNLRPVVYSGSPQSGAGHAWVMDGYQGTDYFHMNWGWGGAMDGYFYLDNLVMNVTSGGEPLDLTYSQQAIINIYPASGYPTFCTGTRTISGFEGTFEDGSGNEDYENSRTCNYLMAPTCGAYTTIEFDLFELEANDAVYIYDGTSVADPLLAVYYGGDVTETLKSSGNGMLIQFITNSSGTDAGWSISYSTEYCPSDMTLEAEAGTIEDGSGSCDYLTSTYCKWTIQPPFATSVTLDFTSFNMADDLDNVKVYANDLGTLVEKFDTDNVPSSPLTVEAGTVIVRFFTDNGAVGTGWSLNYSSLISSVEEESFENNFVVAPNPFNDDAEISYYLDNNVDVTITVSDLIGNVVGVFSTSQGQGSHSVKLSDITRNFDSGLYFISLNAGKNTSVKKVICYR